MAQLGLFTLGTLALLAAAYYVFTSVGAGRGVYRIGVHFATASGLPAGARVFFSGVPIGNVQKVRILPDNSIEVILAIRNNIDIPKGSRFDIKPSFASSPDIVITPPRKPGGAALEKRILPVSQQPAGGTPLSIETLMGEAQGVMSRGSSILAMAHGHQAKMLHYATGALKNRDALFAQLHAGLGPRPAALESSLRDAATELAQSRAALTQRDRPKLNALAAAMDRTSHSMNASLTSLQSIARDPTTRANFNQSLRSARDASRNLSSLADVMKGLTADPQARAELRDAGLQLHAALQKVSSLLKSP